MSRYHHNNYNNNVSSSNAVYIHKPESALRRAQELVGVVGQPLAALQLLHDVLSGRRHRTWAPIYESCMDYYLDLCLQLNKTREAKDGLHQYRNLSQSQAPGSLENVIRTFITKAETACTLAKAQATLDDDADDDLQPDEEEVEEEEEGDDDGERITSSSKNSMMLLSTMSADPAQVQRDSTLLLPKLKFLWESYRAVLDILKSNSKLEHVYHFIASGALKFCSTYKRRTEFRRLCDMLRMHLGNLQKYGNSTTSTTATTDKPNNKVRGWEGWSMESLELHLQTRFGQLETASVLKLYSEGFRTVEDIYSILQIAQTHAKKLGGMPRAKLLATYYEKVSQLFWISSHYLFHAFSTYKHYTLCVEYNRALTEEQLSQLSSQVVLAALIISSSSPEQKKAEHVEKTTRMSTLLGFHTRHPSRSLLLEELLSKKILDKVPTYIRELYVVLEDTLNPLTMVQLAKPLLQQLQESFPDYVEPLTHVLLLKLISALAKSYHTISLQHVQDLIASLNISFSQVEKTIVRAASASNSQLSIRLDHRAQCLRFGASTANTTTMESNEELRTHLVCLSKSLQSIVPTTNATRTTTSSTHRAQVFETVREGLQGEHLAMLQRKEFIEQKKEEVERVAQEKQKEAERKSLEKQRLARAEEEQRLQKEKELREREKLQKIQNEMKLGEVKQYLAAMGKDVNAYSQSELLQLDPATLAKEHADKAAKKKQMEEKKVLSEKKRLDHIVRATRMEEVPKIQLLEKQRVKEEEKRYREFCIKEAQRAKEQWEANQTQQKQLASFSVFDYMSQFESTIMKERRQVHKEECAVQDDVAMQQEQANKLKRAKQRQQDAIKLQKQKQKEQEEEERRRKKEQEEEERRQKEKEMERSEPPKSSRGGFDDLRRGGGGGGGGGPKRYVPPSRRGGNSGSRFGGGGGGGGYNDSRGSNFGGGRYDHNQSGPPEPRNSRWS